MEQQHKHLSLEDQEELAVDFILNLREEVFENLTEKFEFIESIIRREV